MPAVEQYLSSAVVSIVPGPGLQARIMREVSVITRNLMPGPGFKRKFRVTWLVAALLGYLLGAFTASYVPLVLNTIRSAPSRVLAHGLHIQKQEQNAVIENPQVSKPSGQQSRSSEQIQVEGSLSGSTDSGRNGEVGDLVIVEEVGNPPAKQEDDDAPQLAQASVGKVFKQPFGRAALGSWNI